MDRVSFKVNGVSYSVGCEVSSQMTLVDYLRDVLELRGTKYMCREGGCGTCTVSVVKTAGAKPIAVNSCLVSVTSCQDWDITTIEQVGNRFKGYHPIQNALVEHNGTQCGYCSPGWVMAMYSLIKNKNNLTMLDIEKSFGSNICRCTGYRPILDAFKKFAKDAPLNDRILDIEDLHICNKTGKNCDKHDCKHDCKDDDWCIVSKSDVEVPVPINIDLKDGRYWFKVSTIRDVFGILGTRGDDSYMLVSGNTAKGAYPIDEYPRILIDISEVSELKGCYLDQNLAIGAGNTLSDLLNILQNMSKVVYFEYLKKFYDHIQSVAHISVRNLGSIAGNLMIKHQHNEFPSDIFLLLETVGAQLTIVNQRGLQERVSMAQFLKLNMRSKIILNILVPPLSEDTKIVTFKIMPRAQNAHAVVNAGFLYRLRKSDNKLLQCRLVFGGLSPQFSRAALTERYLFTKMPFANDILSKAVETLANEIVVTETGLLSEWSTDYRKKLALGLFYKGLLTICPRELLGSRYASGAIKIHETRPVSDARQIFDTNPALWPLNQPLEKVEAKIQCSGEAPYTEDLPCIPREVFAAFALCTVPRGNIESIDASVALNQPGVLAFYTVKDIPGINSFTPPKSPLYSNNEEVLCDKEVKYFNQPFGIVVAETRHIADRAAKLVKVKYSNVTKPVINIREAKNDSKRLQQYMSSDSTDKGNDVVKVIKGYNYFHEQYHMCMETLVCITRPTEEGIEVHASTQWLDGVQLMISRALNMQQNRIDVYVRRLGGAYGIKISRITQLAIACSLVTQKLNRPCRFIQSLTTNMRAVGKRYNCYSDYEAGVNATGIIQYLNYNTYEGNGYTINETLSMLGAGVFNNCYNKTRWNFKGYDVTTDLAKNTFCRSPGTFEAISMIECIMEHISYEQSLNPVDVRLANLDEQYNDIKEMVETLKKNSNYDERRTAVIKYNKGNRWKKRGLRTSFSRWTPGGGQQLDITLSVYHGDGTVAITHAGVEMGQGVNTKAVQICAYLLNIPVTKIQIKGNNTIIAPNSFISGGSLTSTNVTVGVQRCCEELLKRLDPIKKEMNNPTWEQLISKAFESNIDLQTHGFINALDSEEYNIYGVACAEVEVDILTGELEVIRVDIIQDVGRSVNPEVDMGQVEGAFIMGLGYWTSEKLIFSNTGEVLTDRTWNYYVPQARDIPQDFRVYFKKNSTGPNKFFGAKATGEPPMCLSVVIPFAIREAIVSARSDCGLPSTAWFPVDGPCTIESNCLLAATPVEHFKFN
ncbi:aldehyde oxidase 1-like [Galleria mellonella]|uniref:Aldehyde oxidase 1-like n=1 Tax=Galleria mellonella TaxID=7137 RepID=A0A6J3C512_GALME|nr:aldehyde oxidase 1-like [Galleria mellonella]